MPEKKILKIKIIILVLILNIILKLFKVRYFMLRNENVYYNI